MVKKETASWCWGWPTRKKGFPTFAVLILALGILWLLSDLKIITIDIPFWPVILIIIALGWIVNHYTQ